MGFGVWSKAETLEAILEAGADGLQTLTVRAPSLAVDEMLEDCPWNFKESLARTPCSAFLLGGEPECLCAVKNVHCGRSADSPKDSVRKGF